MDIKNAMMTEVRVKDEAGVVVLPHGELEHLLKEEQVEAVYKYGAFDREVQGQVKTVHDLTKGPYKGYDSSRPRASSVISSQNVDRDGDIVRSGGMVISDAYMKGPQVLPMHAREFPVGMTRRIKQLSKSIWAEWEWLVDLEYTQAKVFQQAWDDYALNSTSIGFMPIEVQINEEGGGVEFTEWELLEYSPVIIPANADAMRTDGLKGLLKAFGDAIMDGPSPIAKRLWEEALAKVNPKQVAIKELPSPDQVVSGERIVVGLVDADLDFQEVKSVIPYKKTPKAPEDEAWDGPKEVAAAEVSDLKIMCTWVDSEDPDVKGSYKLPHHKADGHAVVWKGVSAAMGALMGARAPLAVPDDDRKGIYNHLSKHYAEWDKTPPDFKALGTVDNILSAFEAGAVTHTEAQDAIESRLKEAEEKANEYKCEAEELAARVIRRR